MKKTMIISIVMLLSSASTMAQDSMPNVAYPDAQRERIGLENIQKQLTKINELATYNQSFSNVNDKYLFNYAKFQNEIENLKRQVDGYLYRPLQPVTKSFLDDNGTKFE